MDTKTNRDSASYKDMKVATQVDLTHMETVRETENSKFYLVTPFCQCRQGAVKAEGTIQLEVEDGEYKMYRVALDQGSGTYWNNLLDALNFCIMNGYSFEPGTDLSVWFKINDRMMKNWEDGLFEIY